MKTYSQEAESHLLACALVDESAVPSLLEIPEEWFCLNESKLIYRAIDQLAKSSLTTDAFAVGEYLNQNQQLPMVGGMEAIMELSESLPSLGMFQSFKGALFKYYKVRQISKIKDSLEQQLGTNAKPEQMVEWLSGAMVELMTDHHQGGLEGLGKHLDKALAYIDWKYQNEGAIIGQQTGHKQLDYIIDGFQNGLLYAICARPAMGKTMFAVNLANAMAKNGPVCYFSLEMTGDMLSQRLLAHEAKVSGKNFKSGTLGNDEFDRLGQAATRLDGLSNLHIDESAGLTVAQIRSRLKAFQIKHGKTGPVFIDHIGLIKNRQGVSAYEGLTETVHELQRMAKEFDAPVIMISQLNRNCETRPDKRPTLSDIRQTGAIEEDCRVVMFVYRDEYYYKTESKQQGITEIILAKNSMGETDTLYYEHDLAVGDYREIEGYIAPEPEFKKKL